MQIVILETNGDLNSNTHFILQLYENSCYILEQALYYKEIVVLASGTALSKPLEDPDSVE